MAKNIVIFGEVLWDIFPDNDKKLGGAPFNVAWHLQAFGANPLLISRIGTDDLGAAIQTKMQAWQMTLAGLQIDKIHPTGTVKVILEKGQPQYEITADCAYDFVDSQQFPILEDEFWLYHGSLALRNAVSQASFRALQQRADQIFFDVNLRQPWWTLETIASALAASQYVKLNTEELTLLTPEFSSTNLTIDHLLNQNSLRHIILTAGEAGASLYTQGDRQQISPPKNTLVVDTVGAGDAFCSVCLLGLMNDWPSAQTIERAQAFASAIVGIRGAVSEDPRFYQPFIQAWRL
ncbi:carbohydrate kinase family protein [Picosynechococcus sp. PCC 73109]|uniref:carbohydrate kinase family protein n=1 Tax=Picosynechococcus sp. PCC 73109 TaxID=374982 RepID=UPI000745922F|nr:carbohydrate kinase [Picosynechococcus sp. PCC 73109]AMA08653.1 carbohydrate kinase [Picosynechococcus sp. PCC 73109]